MRAGLDPRGDGRQAKRHHEAEAGRERPAPLGGHLTGITRGQGAMAPVGTVIPGRRSTARVGGTGMAAPVGRSGGSAQQPSPAFPWKGDRSPFGHGTHPGTGGTGFLLAWEVS